MIRAYGVAAALSLAVVAASFPSSAETSKTLGIAVVLENSSDAPSSTALLTSMEQVAKEKPHGLTIELDYIENVDSNADETFGSYAQSGDYHIIIGHGSFADHIETVSAAHPDIMFVMSGPDSHSLGGNAYGIEANAHEPAYAMGMLAGALTRSNTIGTVSSLPLDESKARINAFFAGAQEVNPDIRRKVSFIGSSVGSAQSNAATIAQVAGGADMIYEMTGAFAVCKERKVGCFGNQIDMTSDAPDVIVASATVDWTPHLNWLIDQWWQVATTDQAAFDAPNEPAGFGWSEGGSDLIINTDWKRGIPEDIQANIAETVEAIKEGDFQVEVDTTDPTVD